MRLSGLIKRVLIIARSQKFWTALTIMVDQDMTSALASNTGCVR